MQPLYQIARPGWLFRYTVWLMKPLLVFAIAAAAQAQVQRKDPALDKLVSPTAKVEKLAGGFAFTEGPVWTVTAK